MLDAVCSHVSKIATIGLALISVAATGACYEAPATCGAAPGQPIVGFAISVGTGEVGTSSNILFCFTRKSTGTEACRTLDHLFTDDFRPHAVDEFTWNLDDPIAPGDLDHFEIRNTGGGFLSNSWELASLLVQAQLQGGETVPLYEVEIPGYEYMSKGDSYDSSQCTY
jgi:hypothetical protein